MNKKLFCFSVNFPGRLSIFLSALALSLGGVIYIFLRTSEHVFNSWMSTVGLDNWFASARNLSLFHNLHFPEWMVFSLPNGLWAFAYALLITGIWSGSKSWLKYLWMASLPLLVLGFEVLQYVGIIRGTFCMQDITLGVAGLVVGIIVGIKITKLNNHEKAYE